MSPTEAGGGAAGGMRIVVDWDLCESHGQCEFAAPNVFTINDDGDLEVLDETPPESERSNVEQAIRRCPTRALRLARAVGDVDA